MLQKWLFWLTSPFPCCGQKYGTYNNCSQVTVEFILSAIENIESRPSDVLWIVSWRAKQIVPVFCRCVSPDLIRIFVPPTTIFAGESRAVKWSGKTKLNFEVNWRAAVGKTFLFGFFRKWIHAFDFSSPKNVSSRSGKTKQNKTPSFSIQWGLTIPLFSAAWL